MKTQESIQAWLVTTVAEHLGMNPLDIDIHEPFATYGLESVEMVGLSGDLEDWLGRELSPTLLYDYPTIELLARHLAGDTALPSGVAAQVPYQKGVTGDAVAIIGVGCRFPGGVDSPEAFWHFLKQGKDAISEIPPERWDRDAYYSPDRDAPGKMYTRHGAFLDDISAFDAAFFGISPREALRMDPQQRLLLEVAWEALERAGLAPAALDGSQTGVFIGLMNTLEYAQLQVSQGDSSYLDDPYFGIGSSSSITAGRLAYLLNLHGPALTIDTACSSSLVSLHLACQSLQNRECQLALVGGVNAILLPESLVNACKMGMLSVDGRCKTFDASADGFVLGEGCGVVVLKRLAEALTDGDHILAIIRGSAVNQDGRSNGLTAPNRLAQEAVIRQALANAGVDPRQISYVEAHGSGTALGDPIEIEALVNVLGAERTGDMPLRIGAVKTNIGHLAGAAGIAGLIKTMLALQHQEIPPHLNVHTLNPHISFKECPVEIPSALLPWRVERQPRIAGVSSFGWSGTNAHVIVEEAPAQPSRNPSRTYHLLPLSARSEQALEAASANLLRYLKEHPASNLADIAYTLQTGRSEFTHRRMLVCLDIDDAIRILQTHDPHYLLTGTATIAQNQAALLFPGLAGELEQQEASFRKAVGDYALEQISGQLSLAQMAGKLWLVGAPIDWKGFYTEEQRQKLPLPTYPFERQRYWIGPQKHAQPARHGKKPDIADWFYQRQWKEAPLPEEQLEASAPAPWLIFEDALGLGRQVAAQLAQDGHAVIRVQIGEQFAHPGEDVFCLRPDVKEDYIALCKHLALSHQMPRIVLHCWNVTGQEAGTGDAASFNATQKTGFYSLLALAQALGTQILDEPVRLMVVANYLYAATQQDMLHPEKATIVGACTVIPQENSDILCRSIDVGTAIDEQVANQLRRECMVSVPDLHVAYREQKRYVQQYQPVRLEPTAPVLRQQGVYLITGGLGEVGLMLAAHLAETVQARLALVGRTGFPPREEWKNWLEQHGEEDSISKRIHHLQAMEAVGGEVLILQADIADATRMQEVIDQTLQQFGALHGVIHAAGITTPSTFKAVEAIGRAECETHFRPKVHGLYALSNALAGQHLDFCILFSSISVVLGGLGFIAYAAANSFMDAFVQRYHQRTDAPWFSVNWDTWRTALDAAAIRGTVAEYAMEPFEGIEAFARLLSVRGIPTIVNSTGDLHQRIRQWVHLESLDATKRIAASASEVSSPTESVSAHKTYTDAITAIWQQALGVEKVGLDDNFFDLGGNSLIGLQVLAQLKKAFHVQIPAVVLFEAPTVNALVRYLLPATEQTDAHSQAQMLEERRLKARQVARNQGIAIVGMTGRFPGASNLEQFWQNLQQGVESISFFTPEELEQAGVDPLLLQNPDYVRARPILTGIDQFDAAFFGYSPHEARFTDPQHRLFLECCWDALELAGYDPSTYDGLVGVFGGTNLSTYLLGLASDPALLRSIDDYQIVIGNDKDSLTTTVSYKLNLRGPSFAVQTFCSTSLVAVHLACQSLLAGECDMALAGGVSIRVPSKAGHLYQEGGMESPDGHCRTFDAEARGSIFGDGAGVVVLKRLDEALADGDYIHAIIKGSAINNDGSLKVSYTAPSVMGQAEVVSAALTSAGVSPETMSYVEAHGTATELGDPIEVAALTKAFQAQTARTRYCAIGSVKTNVGHLDRAAGVTGLIKTVLAMQHEELPPSLHFQTPNPEIDFAHSPFYVNATLAPWIRGPAPRRAGINSLGMGGTNAHVVLEEAPPRPAPEVSRPWHLLVLSARSETALGAIAQHLCAYLEQHDDSALADIAYTLQVGRKRFEHRQMLCCRTREEAIQLLRDLEPSRVASHREQRTDRSVTFLFPGLGEQYAGMTQELYRQEAVFRQTVDRCCTILKTQLGIDLRELLYPEEYEANGQQANGTSALAPASSPAHVANGHAAPQAGIDLRAMLNRTNGTGHHPRHDSTSAERLKQTALAQPAVFVLEYALAQLLMQWGIRPQAMLGYSLGEYVAACLSGVLSLEDALTLVARRAALIQQTQEGAMIAVALSEDAVQPYLSQQVSLAVINAPGTCVLAGLFKAIEQVEIRLTAQGVAYRRIETTHAFHSALLEPVQAALTELVRGMALQKPQILYISNVTGTWITPEEATDPAYWARHMCQTVRFAEGVGHLLEETDHILLEVGPGQSLGSFVKQHSLSGRERTVVSSLPARFDKQSEQAAIIHMLGKLWLAGVSIDWMGYHVGTRRYRLPLPTYPFERQSYWLEPSTRPLMKGSVAASSSASVPALSNETERKADIADWFYVPLWKQSPPRTPIDLTAQHCWLVLLDECGVGAKLVSELRRNDQKVVSVSIGKTFTIQGNESYSVNPALRADYVALLQVLRSQKMTPDRIVHLWTITPQNVAANSYDVLDEILEKGFYSLLALAQAIGDTGFDACRISVISNQVQDVSGGETLQPEKSTLIGPCRVISQEYPGIACQSIDVTLSEPGSYQEALLLQQLIAEMSANGTDGVVALRGHHRWMQTFEPVQLLPEAPAEIRPLRQNGVYLITGGPGGIGLAMAEYLAHTVAARLILIGRTAFPPRHEWPHLLATRGAEERIVEQIRKIQALEAAGAEVLVLQADVAEEAQMKAAVQQAISVFGTIHGVLHAAGVPGAGLIQLKTPEIASSVLAPKVKGTLILERVLQHIPLDFMVLFSSITSTTGGPGQVDYCAANAFLDAYAHSRFLQQKNVLAIDWSEWQWNAWEAGLAGLNEEVQRFFKESRRAFGITFVEGAEALSRMLARRLPHVVVSTQDFNAIIAMNKTLTATLLQRAQHRQQVQEAHARPSLANSYVAPRNEIERRIAAYWEQLLGIDRVGIHDNFFELGGNSLIGIDLIGRMRKELDVEFLPAYILYEAPSVSAMAHYLEQSATTPVSVNTWQERSEKRRENLKLRMRETRKVRQESQ